MKMILLIIMVLCSSISFASVSVSDDTVLAQENKAIDNYIGNIQDYLEQLSRTSNSISQLTNLDGLIKEEDNLSKACGKYCSQADMDKIKTYLDDLNTNISGRFKDYANVINNNVKTLGDVRNFINNFQGNTKEIGLALQKAMIQVQQDANNTLLQIQTLMSLDFQKRQKEELFEKQNTNAVYQGFSQSGL